MTDKVENNRDENQWREGISSRISKIEKFIFILSVIFICYLSLHYYNNNHPNFATSKVPDNPDAERFLSHIRDLVNNKFLEDKSAYDTTIAKLSKKIEIIEEELTKLSNQNAVRENEGKNARKEVFAQSSPDKWTERTLPTTSFSLPEDSVTHLNVDRFSGIKQKYGRKLQALPVFQKKEHICENRPILSPTNIVNDFQYDQRIHRILGIIQGLSPAESLSNTETPQYKAACWILYDDELKFSSNNRLVVERYVLATLIYTVIRDDGQLASLNTCEYEFVECNSIGSLIRIELNFQHGSNSIPSELCYLSSLEYLDLSNNGLIGSIPSQFDRLNALKTLDLSHNDLSGEIPSSIGKVPLLEDLILEDNLFRGSIPTELGQLSYANRISLSFNTLEGSIPSELFNCTRLQALHLIGNNLSGTIPTNINQLKKIEVVNFERNKITGPIPSEIGALSSLIEIWWRANEMTNQIPHEIENLHRIQRLLLADNNLNGTIPNIFNNLTDLVVINVGMNNLTGTIPNSLWNRDFYNAVIMRNNDLTGTVPYDLCSRTNFVSLDNSVWFRDEPKINCSCCDMVSCSLWDVDQTVIAGTPRPKCPDENIHNITYFEQNWIEDNCSNITFRNLIGFQQSGVDSICLSPTGCYSLYDATPTALRGTFKHNLGYSSSSKSLLQQNKCDAVEFCGHYFDQYHPKRKGLNHLTQVVFPDLAVDFSTHEYNVMCSLLTEDLYFDQLDVCDGTLLQRYILALLYANHNLHVPNFSSMHTCDCPGITCDTTRKFVTHISLQGVNLSGSLITEIGLLTRLESIDLSNNSIRGTLDPSIFSYLPNLEVFAVGDNQLGGNVPIELLALPRLKEVNFSSNLFVGTFPTGIEYSKILEIFDGHANLMQGTIPSEVYRCINLKELNLSRNSLKGEIQSELGNLRKLEAMKLDQNRLQGIIPQSIFLATGLKSLLLHSNILTGSIPTQVENLVNATHISMSHNLLRGTIPNQFSKLENIEMLRLHHNRLTGEAPQMSRLKELGGDSFIADCGNPSYLLPNPLKCDSCTICCNSDNMCQKNNALKIPLEIEAFLTIISIPIALSILILFLVKARKIEVLAGIWDTRDPLSVYNSDSVYSFIFSQNHGAKLLYVFTVCIQVAFFSLFLHASNFANPSTDWIFTIRCPGNQSLCEDESVIDVFGWILFYTVTLLHLGLDFTYSLYQLEKSVESLDFTLGMSSVVLFGLTALALFTSEVYNKALAKTNRDLIVNAVILLFINDLDEKMFGILHSLFPVWMGRRTEEIKATIESKFKVDRATNDENQDRNSSTIVEVVLKELKHEPNPKSLERYNSGKRMLGLFD